MMNPVIIKEPTSRKVKRGTLKVSKILFVSLIVFLLYFPILIIGILSFNADSLGNDFTGFTLRWYKELFSDEELLKAISNTWLVAIVSTIISTVFGTLTAVGIHSLSKKSKKRMILLNNVPILNADIVTAVALFFIFKAFGLIIGNSFILGLPTMLIAHVFFSTPYVVLCVLPKLNEIDANLYDAALDLGCTKVTALSKVIIPSIKSGILSGAMLAFTMSIDDFVISYFTTSGEVPNFSIWFYSRLRMSRVNPWPKACAYNLLVIMITLVVLVVYNVLKGKENKKKGNIE